MNESLNPPDGLQRLWTPYRMSYIQGESKPETPDTQECPFCLAPAERDAENTLIVAEGQSVYVILNLYPYNAGHLLVCPYRHISEYTQLTYEEISEFSVFTQKAITALKELSSPHGFNVGMNLGSAAGAGIAAHLHQHIVPRWGGDTNFMPVIADTKVLPQLLADTRKLLAQHWN